MSAQFFLATVKRPSDPLSDLLMPRHQAPHRARSQSSGGVLPQRPTLQSGFQQHRPSGQYNHKPHRPLRRPLLTATGVAVPPIRDPRQEQSRPQKDEGLLPSLQPGTSGFLRRTERYFPLSCLRPVYCSHRNFWSAIRTPLLSQIKN